MAVIRQTSFAAGELSPYLYGRTDLDLYGHGARLCRNFVVNRQGAGVSRPGTAYIRDTRFGSWDVILIPFLDGPGDTYLLEVGGGYLRVHNTRAGTVGSDFVSPWRASDLPELQWAQVGRRLVLTHAAHPAHELVSTAGGFVLQQLSYNPGVEAVFPSLDGDPPALPVLVQWSQPGLENSLFVVDAAHPPREWLYKVSTIVRDTETGLVFETLPRAITQFVGGNVEDGTVGATPAATLPTNELVLFPDAPIYIEPGLGTQLGGSTRYVPLENLYYRGRGNLFGLVGRAAPGSRFCDTGVEPDYLTPPLRGDAPFVGTNPSCVAHFQQRRVFTSAGNAWAASATDDFENFDEPILNWPGQPLKAQLLGRRREEPQAMAVLEHLLVLTDTSVWCVGRNDVPLDYDTLPSVTRIVDEVGAKAVPPVILDRAVLYVPATGRGARALAVGEGGGFDSADISWHAEHLFRGATQGLFGLESVAVTGWCYQREPWGTVWVVRNDGALLTCTRTSNGWAWAQHDVGGKVVSVACVPTMLTGLGIVEDIWLVVRRGSRTCVERMRPFDPRGLPGLPAAFTGSPTENIIGFEQHAYPLDSYVVKTANRTGTVVNTGLTHLEGKDVWVSCPGVTPLGPFRVTGGAITIPPFDVPGNVSMVTPTLGYLATFKVAIGLKYRPELELLDAAQARLNHKTVVKVGFEVDQANGLMVGEDSAHLVPWVQRTAADGYDFPSAASALVVVSVPGAWRRTGRAFLRQDLPLPVTVLGVARELEGGGT